MVPACRWSMVSTNMVRVTAVGCESQPRREQPAIGHGLEHVGERLGQRPERGEGPFAGLRVAGVAQPGQDD